MQFEFHAFYYSVPVSERLALSSFFCLINNPTHSWKNLILLSFPLNRDLMSFIFPSHFNVIIVCHIDVFILLIYSSLVKRIFISTRWDFTGLPPYLTFLHSYTDSIKLNTIIRLIAFRRYGACNESWQRGLDVQEQSIFL